MFSSEWNVWIYCDLHMYVRAAVGENVFIYASCTSQIRGQVCDANRKSLRHICTS